jgi:hypothetical protein
MNFDRDTGQIDLLPGLRLHRGMTQLEVLATTAEWEDWHEIDGIPTAFRTIIRLPNKDISARTILIVYFNLEDKVMTRWEILPRDLADGSQYHRAGKYLKRLERWFREMFGTKVPCGGDWGYLHTSPYDFRNDSAAILCIYREAFINDENWNLYKRNKKF